MPLSTDFMNNPQLFCTNYVTTIAGSTSQDAVLPREHHDGVAFQNTGTFFNNRAPGGAAIKMGYVVAANASNVCWYQYEPGKVRLVRQNSFDHQTVTGGGTALNDWFPAYFLPWGSGKIGRMEIPAQLAGAVANPVRAFFTAEMNGCSFFVGGSKSAPVVAHYNVAPGGGAPLTQDDKDQVQNAMVKSLIRKTPVDLSGKRVAALRWKAATYAGDATSGATIATTGTVYDATAVEDAAAQQNIANALPANTKLIAGPANPTGVVTNIRVAMMGTLDLASRQWTFFYQRNFFTQSNYKTRLGKAGGLIKFVGQDNRQLQTLIRFLHIPGSEYTELWPNGPGVVRMPNHGDPDQ